MQTRSPNLGVALGALALGLAAIAFAPLARAGAEAIALSNTVLTVEQVIGGTLGADVMVTYDYDSSASTIDETSAGNGYGNADQIPDTAVSDELAAGVFETQESFSEAGGAPNAGSGYAALAGEGYLTIANLTGADIEVVFGYEIDLSAEVLVTSNRFADAYARAMVAIFDDRFAVDITRQVEADYANGPTDTETDFASSTLSVFLGADQSLVVRVQTQTEAQAQFAPEPASLALMTMGLVGAGLARRRPAI